MGALLLAPLRAWESLWATRLGRAIGYLGALGGLLWAELIYFPVEYTPPPAGVPASPWPWEPSMNGRVFFPPASIRP